MMVGLFLGVWLTSGLANASPLWQVKGGQTSLALGDALVTALTDCEVSLIKQGAYKPDDAEVRFRVVGGALDADDLAGEVFHSGGIAVSCATMEPIDQPKR